MMADKPIRFSGHALFEMKRRGISRTAAESAIRKPGQVVPSEKGREIYQNSGRPAPTAAPPRNCQGRR